jgi:C4-type Zn-finger protein
VKTKVSKSVQITFSTIGNKSAIVRVVIKDPSGKSYLVSSRMIAKNKSYATPKIKFLRAGTCSMTITYGTTKKVITFKVSK